MRHETANFGPKKELFNYQTIPVTIFGGEVKIFLSHQTTKARIIAEPQNIFIIGVLANQVLKESIQMSRNIANFGQKKKFRLLLVIVLWKRLF